MNKITLQDIEDFEYELAIIQNKYGLLIETESYDEWDENLNGDLVIVGHRARIIYTDLQGNVIDKEEF